MREQVFTLVVFSVGRQAFQIAPCGHSFQALTVVLQQFSQYRCGVLVPPPRAASAWATSKAIVRHLPLELCLRPAVKPSEASSYRALSVIRCASDQCVSHSAGRVQLHGLFEWRNSLRVFSSDCTAPFPMPLKRARCSDPSARLSPERFAPSSTRAFSDPTDPACKARSDYWERVFMAWSRAFSASSSFVVSQSLHSLGHGFLPP